MASGRSIWHITRTTRRRHSSDPAGARQRTGRAGRDAKIVTLSHPRPRKPDIGAAAFGRSARCPARGFEGPGAGLAGRPDEWRGPLYPQPHAGIVARAGGSRAHGQPDFPGRRPFGQGAGSPRPGNGGGFGAGLPERGQSVLLDPEALAAAPREIGLRALAALLKAVSAAAYPPRFESLERLFDRMGSGAWRGATLHGCHVAPVHRAHQVFGPKTLVITKESSRGGIKDA